MGRGIASQGGVITARIGAVEGESLQCFSKNLFWCYEATFLDVRAKIFGDSSFDYDDPVWQESWHLPGPDFGGIYPLFWQRYLSWIPAYLPILLAFILARSPSVEGGS